MRQLAWAITACLLLEVTNCDARQMPAPSNHAPINPTPDDPSVHNFFFVTDSFAAELLRSIINEPASPTLRRRLAEYYDANYVVSREFFRQTAGYVDGSVPPVFPAQGVEYRCATEVGPESHTVYLDLQRKFGMAGDERSDEYIRAIAQAIKTHGASCDLEVMWARAVIAAPAKSVSDADLEKALRIVFNFGEQYSAFHENSPAPQLFLDVAYAFAERDDYVSAYIAATWAQDRLNVATDLDPNLRNEYARKIGVVRSTYRSRARPR